MRERAVDAADGEVRVGVSVSVAREMLGRGKASEFVGSADEGRDEGADLGGIFAESTSVDDGIVGIGVDGGVWEEIPLHTDGASFGGTDATELVGVVGIDGRTEGHGVRKDGASAQTHGQAALEVGGKQKRQVAIALKLVDDRRGLQGTGADEQTALGGSGDAPGAEMVLVHRVAQPEVLRAIEVPEVHLGPDHEELANLLFERHVREGALGPAGSGGIGGGSSVGNVVAICVTGTKPGGRQSESEAGEEQERNKQGQQFPHDKNHSIPGGQRHNGGRKNATRR